MLVEKLVLAAIVPAAVWSATTRLLRARCRCPAKGGGRSFGVIAVLAAASSLAATLAMVLVPLWRAPIASWGHPDTWRLAAAGPSPLWPVLASGILIVVGAVDAACRIVPDQALLLGIMLGLSQAQLEGRLSAAVLGGFAGAMFFLLLYFLRPKALGFGDVKLAGFIGVAVGLNGLPVALGSGILLGGLYAAVLLLVRAAGWKDSVPYGPPLALGGIVGLWCAVAGMVP
jgi:leader peptidase (prepilin peptidase)/N-methyltransferase